MSQKMEKKPIRHADRTLLNTHPQVMEVGNATTVGTVAHLAAVKQIAGNFAVKEGDQIEWKAELEGLITVTRSMLDAATEELIR
jgi:hypothetical protein